MRNVLDDPSSILDIMRDIAETEIMSRFRSLDDSDISEKAPGDLVTIADQESERVFSERLPTLIPGSQILGEEGYEADPNTLLALKDESPVWIVDPVDGTFNFAHGKSPFTVIVALVQNQETLAGWILDPLSGDAVWAIKGNGAYQISGEDSAPFSIVREIKPYANTKLTAGIKLRKRFERAADEMNGTPLPSVIERYRCVGREYMDIALGILDHARYGSMLKPWDHAAGCLIVRECGGRADHIDNQTPYTAEPDISWRTIGITGNADHWDDWRTLVQRADSYI
jgi:fructose-1,6-bisphosphatase/inositol monophosphatase family enzyme